MTDVICKQLFRKYTKLDSLIPILKYQKNTTRNFYVLIALICFFPLLRPRESATIPASLVFFRNCKLGNISNNFFSFSSCPLLNYISFFCILKAPQCKLAKRRKERKNRIFFCSLLSFFFRKNLIIRRRHQNYPEIIKPSRYFFGNGDEKKELKRLKYQSLIN